jgi:DnaK suppressor protein
VNTKMSRFAASFLENQRERLLALRLELLRTRETQETEEKDIQSEAGGRAREYEEDAQNLAMLELDGNLANRAALRLAHIERALKKIEEGTYGMSDASGKPIPIERLQAIPEAIYTLDEQQAREPAAQ